MYLLILCDHEPISRSFSKTIYIYLQGVGTDIWWFSCIIIPLDSDFADAWLIFDTYLIVEKKLTSIWNPPLARTTHIWHHFSPSYQLQNMNLLLLLSQLALLNVFVTFDDDDIWEVMRCRNCNKFMCSSGVHPSTIINRLVVVKKEWKRSKFDP